MKKVVAASKLAYRYAVGVDYQPNDEGGVATVTLRVSGRKVYGFLKGERGVHRHRTHESHASQYWRWRWRCLGAMHPNSGHV